MQIHHVGYIVYDVNDTSIVKEDLHQVALVFDPIQEANIALYKNQKDELIEFIQPFNDKSPVWNFLKKNGNKFHHYCYVGSKEMKERFIKENHLVKIMGPVPAPVFDNQNVEFYVDKNLNITEFID